MKDKNEKDQTRACSRRNFIRDMGSRILAGSAAGAGLATVNSQTALAATAKWSETYDWICVGSGIAGCSSAIAAHDKGLKTIVLEKMDSIGGTTSQSGGHFWVPMNSLAKAAEIQDSREEALAFLTFVGSGYSRAEYRESFVDNAARVLDYLREKADFKFRLGGSEFYYPISPGSKKLGRIVDTIPFPAENLGNMRGKVLNSVFVRGLNELAKTEDSADEPAFSPNLGADGPYRNNQVGIDLWKKKFGAGKVDAVLKKDEAQRRAGAALAAYAVQALQKRGVEIRTNANVVEIIKDGDRVVGLTVIQDGKKQNLRATKGVMLAMGGGLNGPGGHGDCWSLASGVGGALFSTSALSPVFIVSAPGELFVGSNDRFGRANTEAAMSHSIVVNRFAERFGDESFFEELGGKINHFESTGEHRFRNYPAYLVFDSSLLEKHSFVGLPPGNTEHLEWLPQATTIQELAEKMKLPADKLQATVSRFNDFVRKGDDADFSRKVNTMGAIEKPPFYGVELTISDPFVAEPKVVINTRGQVLHSNDESPIPGLYAGGTLIAYSRIWGVGFQGGCALMSSAVYGFLAAEDAAAS
jgi:3-oxosteroid 1-dehydrogenase